MAACSAYRKTVRIRRVREASLNHLDNGCSAKWKRPMEGVPISKRTGKDRSTSAMKGR